MTTSLRHCKQRLISCTCCPLALTFSCPYQLLFLFPEPVSFPHTWSLQPCTLRMSFIVIILFCMVIIQLNQESREIYLSSQRFQKCDITLGCPLFNYILYLSYLKIDCFRPQPYSESSCHCIKSNDIFFTLQPPEALFEQSTTLVPDHFPASCTKVTCSIITQALFCIAHLPSAGETIVSVSPFSISACWLIAEQFSCVKCP